MDWLAVSFVDGLINRVGSKRIAGRSISHFWGAGLGNDRIAKRENLRRFRNCRRRRLRLLISNWRNAERRGCLLMLWSRHRSDCEANQQTGEGEKRNSGDKKRLLTGIARLARISIGSGLRYHLLHFCRRSLYLF